MRVSRVSPASQNLKAGGILKIFDGDFFNPDPKDSETRGDFVTEIALGCDQVKMPWIYLISEKMAPETEEEHDERHAPCKTDFRLQGSRNSKRLKGVGSTSALFSAGGLGVKGG